MIDKEFFKNNVNELNNLYKWSKKNMDTNILKLEVAGVVTDLVIKEVPFTAYDVTVALRDKLGGHVANHAVIKDIVLDIFNEGGMDYRIGDSFSRELIGLGVDGKTTYSYVYFNSTYNSAFDHPLAKKQTAQIAVEDDEYDDDTDGDVADNTPIKVSDFLPGNKDDHFGMHNAYKVSGKVNLDDVVDKIEEVCTITQENRLNIPINIVDFKKPNNNGEYLIYVEKMGNIEKGRDTDGRVRITLKRYDPGDKVTVSVNNISNSINVFPRK